MQTSNPVIKISMTEKGNPSEPYKKGGVAPHRKSLGGDWERVLEKRVQKKRRSWNSKCVEIKQDAKVHKTIRHFRVET